MEIRMYPNTLPPCPENHIRRYRGHRNIIRLFMGCQAVCENCKDDLHGGLLYLWRVMDDSRGILGIGVIGVPS